MRIKTAHIALLLSIIALAVSLFTAAQVSSNDNDALIDALMVQNQQLQAQIDALSSTDIPDAAAGTTLTAAGWADGRGADITLTLDFVPAEDALLRVMMGNEVITEAPCLSDGGSFTATAQVPAGNGYTYSLIIGSEARTLAAPEDPVYPELVYLADALSAYCNLVVGEWYVRDDVLTLERSYAHIQTPQLSTSGAITCTQACLVLKNGETVLAEVPYTPTPEAETGSYEDELIDAAFSLPELAEGEQVDLWLEATLSDGQVLTTCAATWYAMPSGFSMAAG